MALSHNINILTLAFLSPGQTLPYNRWHTKNKMFQEKGILETYCQHTHMLNLNGAALDEFRAFFCLLPVEFYGIQWLISLGYQPLIQGIISIFTEDGVPSSESDEPLKYLVFSP